MGASFVVDQVDLDGNTIKQDIAFDRLDYSRSFSAVGAMTITLGPGYDIGQFERDTLLRVWRTPLGGGTSLEASAIWFVREKSLDLNTGLISLKCEDQMGLLKRRIVRYRSQTILADHANDGTWVGENEADDMMKDYVRENMGVNAVIPPLPGVPDTARDLRPYFTVASDESLGPIVEETASMKNIFATLRSLRDKARSVDGTEIFFDVKANLNGIFEFRTLIGSLGVSQQGSIGGLIFSTENGSLTKAALTWDWKDELTYAYIGIGGHTSSHQVDEYNAPDDRDLIGYWNRIETYVPGEDLNNVQFQAESVLDASRPKVKLSAETVDTTDIVYGIHYFYGDSVWVQAGGYKFLCHIHAIKNRISAGKESPVVNLVGEIPIT